MKGLRRMRRAAGLTQADLAWAAGLSQHTVSEIETGRREARPSTLRKLADTLDCEVSDFFKAPVSAVAETLASVSRGHADAIPRLRLEVERAEEGELTLGERNELAREIARRWDALLGVPLTDETRSLLENISEFSRRLGTLYDTEWFTGLLEDIDDLERQIRKAESAEVSSDRKSYRVTKALELTVKGLVSELEQGVYRRGTVEHDTALRLAKRCLALSERMLEAWETAVHRRETRLQEYKAQGQTLAESRDVLAALLEAG